MTKEIEDFDKIYRKKLAKAVAYGASGVWLLFMCLNWSATLAATLVLGTFSVFAFVLVTAFYIAVEVHGEFREAIKDTARSSSYYVEGGHAKIKSLSNSLNPAVRLYIKHMKKLAEYEEPTK